MLAQKLYFTEPSKLFYFNSNMLKYSNDTILYQYILLDTIAPYLPNTSHTRILKSNGTIIIDKEVNQWKDSSFFFTRIVKSGDGNFYGAGLTNDSCIELMKFDKNLNATKYIKLRDSTCYAITFSTLSVIGNKILMGGRCSTYRDSADNNGYIYDVSSTTFAVKKAFYIPEPSPSFYPATLHYRTKDSCYYFVSYIHPILQSHAGYDTYMNKMRSSGQIDTVMLVHGDFGLMADSVYNLIDITSFLDNNDSIFYLSSTARVDRFDSTFQTISIKRYPIQLSLKYDDFKKIKEQIITENNDGDDKERVGYNSMINKNDTLYQLTIQKTKQQYRIQAFNLNLSKLFEFYVPFSNHNFYYPFVYNFDIEDRTLYNAGNDLSKLYLLIQSGVFLEDNQIEHKENKMNVYPNPVHDKLFINNVDDLIGYSIFDYTGKLINTEGVLRNETTIIKTEGIKPGIYFLQLNTQNGFITKKIIKM